MNNKNIFKFIIFGILVSFLSISVFTQSVQTDRPFLKRTKYQTETVEIGPGGGFSIIGSPNGSIEIEGWNQREMEISAEIIVKAYNENDLAQMADVTGFVIEEGLTRVSVVSVGTNDKKYLKKVSKKFPKELISMPFEINYKIKVPYFTDLEVNGGKGDFKLSKVEGMMRINYLESNATMNLIGGAIQATIGSGDIDVTIGTRSWRGQFAEIYVTNGNMNLWLPKNLNANIKAEVLKNGTIENSYQLLKPMRRTKFTEKEMYAKAGNGGAELTFKVGDGSLKIGDFETVAKK